MTEAQTFQILLALATAALTIGGTWVVNRSSHSLTLERETRLRDEEIERRARHAAMIIVCLLDSFIIQCCRAASDEGEVDREGYTIRTSEAPTLILPEDLDWRTLRPELMYGILALPNDLASAEQTISAAADFASLPDYAEAFEASQMEYAKLGLAALRLVRQIREAYEIPVREFGGWKPSEVLDRTITKVQNELRDREKRLEAMSALV